MPYKPESYLRKSSPWTRNTPRATFDWPSFYRWTLSLEEPILPQQANARAMELIDKAISLDPEEGYAYALRGFILCRCGSMKKLLPRPRKHCPLTPTSLEF